MLFADDLRSGTGREDFLEALKPGPAGEEPRWPGGNSIKRGVAGEFPRVAEDVTALIGRAQEVFSGFNPGNEWHGWLVDQIAVTTLRLDRMGRSDRRMRDRAAIRAEVCWDEDRMMAAEVAGRGIAEVPGRVVGQLRATPHGCDWLIRRWAVLGQAAEAGRAWTTAQVALAHDLLAAPVEDRGAAPGRSFGGGDGMTEVVPDRAELARREIARLRARKAEVARLDAFDRAMVEADLEVEPTPELRRLGRLEKSLRGWLRWLVAQIRQDAPKRMSPVGLYPQIPDVGPGAKPEPEAAGPGAGAGAPAAEAAKDEVEAADPDGPAPLPRVARSSRKDPRECRDEAHQRKRERRRA